MWLVEKGAWGSNLMVMMPGLDVVEKMSHWQGGICRRLMRNG